MKQAAMRTQIPERNFLAEEGFPRNIVEKLDKIEIPKAAIPLETKVDLNVRDALAVEVFRYLAEQAGCSVFFDFKNDKSASRTLSAYFHRYPAGHVISAVAESLGFFVSYSPGLLKVSDHIQISVRLPVILFNQNANFGNNDVTIKVEDKLASDLEDNLKKLIGENGEVILDRQTGEVIMDGRPGSLEKAISYLKRLRDELLQYVYLTMHIVKVNAKKLHERGIDLKKLFTVNGKKGIFELTPGLPQSPTFGATIEGTNIIAALAFLEEENLGRVVSSPSIMIRNGAMATISIVNQVGWVEPGEYSVTTSESSTVGERSKPEFKTTDVGVVITVKPKIIKKAGVVQALFKVEDSNLDRFMTYSWQPNSEVEPVELQYPLVSKRTFLSQVAARADKYIILGGFREKRKENNKKGLPFLGKLPVIGDLTGHTSREDMEIELYIILNFHVVS